MKKSIILFFLVFLSMLISGCEIENDDLYGKWILKEFSYVVDGEETNYLDRYKEYYLLIEKDGASEIHVTTTSEDKETVYVATYSISEDKKSVTIDSDILRRTFAYKVGLFKDKLVFDTGNVKTEAFFKGEGEYIISRTKIIFKKG